MVPPPADRSWQQRSIELCPPFAQEQAAAFRVAQAGRLRGGDAVHPEVAEAATQFTPCHRDPRLIEECDGERPYRADRGFAFQIAIAQRHTMFPADRRTDRG